MHRRRPPSVRGGSVGALRNLLRPAAERGTIAGARVPGRRGTETPPRPGPRGAVPNGGPDGGTVTTMAGGDIAKDIAARTDSYFTRTRKIVERFGDKPVTYAIFLRRP